MAAPERTWNLLRINTPSSRVPVERFKDIIFTIKNALVSAGWTITISSNGTTAGAGDNIASVNDIVLGTSGNGSWFVAQSPTDFADRNGNSIWFRLGINETSTTNPDSIVSEISTATYFGGSTSSLPTTAGTTASMAQSMHYLPNSLGALNPYVIYNALGEIFILFKYQGDSFSWGMVGFFRMDGSSDYDFTIKFDQSTPQLLQSFLSFDDDWFGFEVDGNTSSGTGRAIVSNGFDFTSVDTAIDASMKIFEFPIDVFDNDTSNGRYLGALIDFRWGGAGAGTTSFKFIQDPDDINLTWGFLKWGALIFPWRMDVETWE